MSEMDSEILILEVEKHPCLYDLNDDNYKNKTVKSAAWMDISKGVVGEENWNEMKLEEKSKSVKDCQMRWRYLRDAFNKALKNQDKRGSAAKKKRLYIYQRQMSFLIPTLECLRTSGDNDYTEFLSSVCEEQESRPCTSSASEISTSFKPSLKRKHKQKDHYESVDIINTTRNVPSTEDQHPDKLFLLSLFPKVSTIDESKKLQFQIEILQLLQKFTKNTHSS